MTAGRERPPFDELPVIETLGLRHAWGVHGEDDQIGTVNLLTPGRVRAAAALVQTGEVLNLTLPLTEPDPPLFGRDRLQHTIYRTDRNTVDDRLDSLFPQGSSQWDGLRHVQCREYGFYGGITEEPEVGSGRLGIEHVVQHGLVGRGVLLDIGHHLAAHGAAIDPLADRPVTVAELTACSGEQGVALQPGDILCIRFGWTTAYRALDPEGRDRYAAAPAFAGLHAGDDTARFLWDSGVACLVVDNPAVETAPGSVEVGSLHRRLLPLLGFMLGELFDLDRLAEECRQDGRWDFLFMAAPLNMPGAIGSPANAVAVR